MDPERAKKAALKKAQSSINDMYAELCYWYPQYELSEFGEGGKHEDMPIGDIELLLNKARLIYYQNKLDTLYVVTAAQSKGGFRKVKSNLEGMIKKVRARI